MLRSAQVDWSSESALLFFCRSYAVAMAAWGKSRDEWMVLKRCACLASSTQRNAYRHRDRLISEETVETATVKRAAARTHASRSSKLRMNWNANCASKWAHVIPSGLCRSRFFCLKLICWICQSEDLTYRIISLPWEGRLGREVMKSKACRLLYCNTLLVTVTLETCIMATQHNLLTVNTQFIHSKNMLCHHTTSDYVKYWSQKQPLLWKWSKCNVMKFHACKHHMKLYVSKCDAVMWCKWCNVPFYMFGELPNSGRSC